jgi:UDP-glucose 4-epimerase
MSRFLMPLSEAVDLVLYAFEHARPGDLFVRKAVACPLPILVDALTELFGVDCETRCIGIRHGEKLYETLVTAEEMSRAEDMGDYFRIPLDTGDLRYSLYYTEGSPEGADVQDFNSVNVPQLDVAGVKELLRTLPEIQRDLEEFGQV